MVEFGEAKVDVGAPIFNYSIAYDTKNAKPLFYETYLGSIADISQLEFMLGKAIGYGYKNIGFILDRGYFSKGNIRKMDEYGYSFVIMVKGMAKLVNRLVLENKGKFEEERKYCIRKHHVYGYTVKEKLYLDDENDRYFHIYHSTGKEHGEKEELEELLERMSKALEAQYGTDYQLSNAEKKYFDTFYDSKGILTLDKEKDDVIKRELQLCGYFCIVTSDRMSAAEALDLYYSRDASEKLFRGDKSYLGNKSERTHLNESTDAKIFVEFVALIVRNRIFLNGDIYDVISYSECGGLMDEKEARVKFDKLMASANRLGDGTIEVRIPVLVRGEEELEEDVPDGDEPFYYLAEYEEIDRSDFDEESLELFNEIDL